MNTKLLTEKFTLIRNKEDKENDLLFKEIKIASKNSTKEFYNEEDILGLCVVGVLKKCTWLNSENNNDFNNVRDFVILLLDEIKNTSLRHNDVEFYKLASTIIGLSNKGDFKMREVKASNLKAGDCFAIDPNKSLIGEIVGIELISNESIVVTEKWWGQEATTKRQCSKDYIYYVQDSIFGDEDGK